MKKLATIENNRVPNYERKLRLGQVYNFFVKMELRRLFVSRRLVPTVYKFIVAVLFLVFAFSLFVRSGTNDVASDNINVNIINDVSVDDAAAAKIGTSQKVDLRNGSSPFTTHYITAKFIAEFYEEEGIPYDNYCQVKYPLLN